MQMVIKIPEEEYKRWQEVGEMDAVILRDALVNGKPLPKGHGRILDEKDILDTKNNDGGWYDLVDMPEYIAGIKAIIEADTKSEETE